MPSPAQQILARTPIDNATVNPPGDPPPLSPLESMTRNRDLWAKVAGERLLEIGKLKEWLDLMRKERDFALAEVTVARAVGGEPASGEIPRLKAELVRAVEERDAAHRACDRMDKAFNESQDNCTRAARMVASRDKEIETLSGELLRCVSQRDLAVCEREEIRASRDQGVAAGVLERMAEERDELRAELESAKCDRDEYLEARNDALIANQPLREELEKAGKEIERFKAENSTLKGQLENWKKTGGVTYLPMYDDKLRIEVNRLTEEVSRLKVDLIVALTERNQARSEREKLAAAFEAFVALYQEDDEGFDDIADEELDDEEEGDLDSDSHLSLVDGLNSAIRGLAARITRLEAGYGDLDPVPDPDSDDSSLWELSGKIGMANGRIDRLGNILFELGGKVDALTARVDSESEAARNRALNIWDTFDSVTARLLRIEGKASVSEAHT